MKLTENVIQFPALPEYPWISVFDNFVDLQL